MKYIDSEKLIAEIERRIGICKRVAGDERNEEDMRRYYQGKVVALEEIQHLAPSLQQEQPEVNLDREIDQWFDLSGIGEAWENGEWNTNDVTRTARHFYELGCSTQYQKDRGEFAKLKMKEWSDGFDAGYAEGIK